MTYPARWPLGAESASQPSGRAARADQVTDSRPASRRIRSPRALLGGAALVALTTGGIGLPAAPANAASESTWDALAQCESGGNWAINTGNSGGWSRLAAANTGTVSNPNLIFPGQKLQLPA